MKTIEIPEEEKTGMRLGRHVEHDPRSRSFAFGVIFSNEALHRKIHRRYGILNQGRIGSCTGNAVVGVCNTAPSLKRHEEILPEEKAVEVYSLATRLDPWPGAYPPQDTGSSGLAAAKAGVRLGLIKSYQHAFSLEEALSALMTRPVITGVNWYEGFDRPNHTGYVNIGGQVRGGHEFEIIGFEPRGNFPQSLEECRIIAANSWGPEWGLYGRFWFTVGTWRRLLAEDGDVTILN